MKIPKHLQWPGMSTEQKKRQVALVQKSRNAMSKAPAFSTTEEAVEEAVKMAKGEKYSSPSVWKEPQDVGKKYAVVHADNREVAQNAGYTEEVDEQEIYDLAHGIKRENADQDPDEIDIEIE